MIDKNKDPIIATGMVLMEPRRLYIIPDNQSADLWLPEYCVTGSELEIHGKGVFCIKQHKGQRIFIAHRKTTRGEKGFISVKQPGRSMLIYCRIKDKDWGVSVFYGDIIEKDLVII